MDATAAPLLHERMARLRRGGPPPPLPRLPAAPSGPASVAGALSANDCQGGCSASSTGYWCRYAQPLTSLRHGAGRWEGRAAAVERLADHAPRPAGGAT